MHPGKIKVKRAERKLTSDSCEVKCCIKKTLNIFRPEIHADYTVMQFYTTPQLESWVLVYFRQRTFASVSASFYDE